MQFPPLGWEDPLEEGMATHSSILAWRIPWTEEPGGLQPTGLPARPRVSSHWPAGASPAPRAQGPHVRACLGSRAGRAVLHKIGRAHV